jgi:hypothetical protein
MCVEAEDGGISDTQPREESGRLQSIRNIRAAASVKRVKTATARFKPDNAGNNNPLYDLPNLPVSSSGDESMIPLSPFG